MFVFIISLPTTPGGDVYAHKSVKITYIVAISLIVYENELFNADTTYL